MKRICIYPKDISVLTGKSYRQSLKIYHAIRTNLKKESHQVISSEELSSYLGIDLETIKNALK